MSPARVRQIVRVVIYTRISESDLDTTPEADRQEEEVRDKLDEVYGPDGYEVIAVLYDHDKSAWKKNVRRPGFDRTMQLCETGAVDVVAAWSSDRLYRRVDTLEKIIEVLGDDPRDGIAFVCKVDMAIDLTTANGRYIARSQANQAEYESARKSERIRSQVAYAYRQGWAPPASGYGFRYRSFGRKQGGTYDHVPSEVDAIRRLAELLLPVGEVDGLAPGDAADVLNDEGVVYKPGQLWTANAIRKIMARPTLAGHIPAPDGYLPGNWTPILEPDLWQRVYDELTDPSRKKRRPRGTYWLRGDSDGLGLFDQHGVEMVGRRGENRNGYERRMYQTSNAHRKIGPGRCTTVDAEAVERFAETVVGQRLHLLSWSTPKGNEAVSEAEAAVANLDARLNALRAEYEEGEMTSGEFRTARAVVMRRLEAAKAQARSTRRRRGPGVRAGNLVKRWKLAPDAGGLSDGERYRLMRWALGPVTVGPSGLGCRAATMEGLAARLSVRPDAPVNLPTATGDDQQWLDLASGS